MRNEEYGVRNEKMTDEQVIKALECCSKKDCSYCPAFYDDIECGENTIKLALDLINRLKAENDDLFYKLTGVMHSVDKWLDDKELEQDEVNRAATMREKTLRIVEGKQAEIERYKGVIKILEKDVKDARERKVCGTCRFYADGICGSVHGMNGKVTKGDYCSHHNDREDVKDEK